jgi:hypothetical protein
VTELPPDPPRLRAILAYLNEQLAKNGTVNIYLQLQLDAVREALAKVEGGQPAPPWEPEQPPREQPHKAPARDGRRAGPFPTFIQGASSVSSAFVLGRRPQAVGDDHMVIHTAGCPNAGPAEPLDPHDARGLLLDSGLACPFCRPDTELDVLD